MRYRDIILGKTRTWEYGTEKQVEILEVVRPGQSAAEILICGEPGGEGFVLYQTRSTFEKGERGVITFVQGGPLGGYWKFTRRALGERRNENKARV